MNYKLTVVVTIYNVGTYLEECISSILSQEYDNLEIILVNDGSTDNSLEICEKYVFLDHRVKVITKNNEGLVAARKTGIEAATGEYITFVDGDDYLHKDYYSSMMKVIIEKDPDLFVASHILKREQEYIPMRQTMEDGIYSGDNLLYLKRNMNFYEKQCYEFGVSPSVCMKIFKTEKLKEVDSVPNSITFGEDACFSFPYILKSNSVIVDNSINGYIYRFVNNSMSRNEDHKKLFEADKVYEYLKPFYYSTGDKEIIEQLEIYKTYLAEHALHSMMEKTKVSEVSKKTREIQECVKESKLYENVKFMLSFDVSERFRTEIELIDKSNWRLFEKIWKRRLVLYYPHTMVKRILKKLLKVCFHNHIQTLN